MKKLVLLCLLALFPMSSSAMLPPQKYWFCAQPGVMEGKKVLLVVPVHENHLSWQHDRKVKEFEKFVMKQVGEDFTGQFEPYCLGYDDDKKAEKHLKKVIYRAMRLGFRVFNINIDNREDR